MSDKITDEIMEAACKAAFADGCETPIEAALRAAYPLIEKQVREECAEVCSPSDRGAYDSEMRSYGDHFADAIRALGEKP